MVTNPETTQVLSTDSSGSTVRRTVLPSGLRIITETIPSIRSVSFGAWVSVGSRDEPHELSGVSHFLEHLLFKGTRARTAWDISAHLEAVGGEINAFTTKEYTCYYARVLDRDLPLAVDVICDIVTDSVLADDDIDLERGVILEEIAMHDDEPSEDVHDILTEALYGSHPLARRILGTVDSISLMSPSHIRDFYHDKYVCPNIVIAAAGNVRHEDVVEYVTAAFGKVASFTADGQPASLREGNVHVPIRHGQIVIRDKDTEQAHLVVGGAGFPHHDERRFALGALNNVLGAGMSSRLFQQIRERKGLAYSVYSYTAQFADTGMFAIYAGCAPTKIDEVLTIVRDELGAAISGGMTDAEVERGKNMLKGAVVLGLEDTGSRMSRLGKGEVIYGELRSVDDILAKIDAVTPELVNHVAVEVLSQASSLAVVGPLKDHDLAGVMSGWEMMS